MKMKEAKAKQSKEVGWRDGGESDDVGTICLLVRIALSLSPPTPSFFLT